MTEQKKKKLIPIGIDDFERLLEGNYYFADKSLLIKELLDSGAAVTLLPRPRRFGKTLNLSMLRYFFEKVAPLIPSIGLPLETNVSRESGLSRRHLFNGLKIEQHADCMEHQGRYPVIWLTFKDVKTDRWEVCYEKIRKVISAEFKRHFDAIRGFLSKQELRQVQDIIAETASQASYENSLMDLSRYLECAYKAKVVILIDEYDAPIHAAYLNGYYNEVIGFMRGFLGAGLKGNNALNFGVLTGILRVAKESIFSGINNLRVCTLIQDSYANQFGFLEDEVRVMLAYFELENKLDEVKRWYNGYQSGSYKVYNPWSIINLAGNKGVIQAYWVNTSDNALIKDLLKRCTPEMKEDLEIVIKGGKVTKAIQENIIMLDIEKNDAVLWNFLLFSGYLTFENYRLVEDTNYADLLIPNIEVGTTYKNSFSTWFAEGSGMRNYTKMLEGLVAGEMESFQDYFMKFTRDTLSIFDVHGDEPERFYHALVLGMLATLASTHEVRSNRESGYGRYDVSLIPKDLSKPGIILEFKKVNIKRKETLKTAAQNALNQIKERDYETELRARGLKDIIKLGISFKGKESFVLVG
ncbi:MAG: hypothetical protein UV38_C0003G0236 [candidate division TM6 bacterium GW2011_GWE2_42_60]|nr:MAG: hypothetical protein UV38_C0003G0236 [candidate division TM6 bacterium GW2011_GWE2_42_60]HBY05854.1 AAA family ATPase [Candidatus Dependentiae bacterium]